MKFSLRLFAYTCAIATLLHNSLAADDDLKSKKAAVRGKNKIKNKINKKKVNLVIDDGIKKKKNGMPIYNLVIDDDMKKKKDDMPIDDDMKKKKDDMAKLDDDKKDDDAIFFPIDDFKRVRGPLPENVGKGDIYVPNDHVVSYFI